MSKDFIDRDDFIDLFRSENEEAEIALWEYGCQHFVRINIHRSRGLSRADAEDIWSEVYTKFLKRKCRSYKKSKAPFKWWARKVVKRAGAYYLRSRRNELTLEHIENYDELKSRNYLYHENLGGEEESGGLDKYLDPLSEKIRVVLMLMFDEGLTVDLIAEKLDLTESAVRMRISRGLQKLRELLKGSDPRELQRRRRTTE